MGPFPYAPDETDIAPITDAVGNLRRAGSLPFALGARAGAGVNDFLANLTASMMGMKRPDPSASSTASSRTFLDPSFKAAGEIGESFNPMPMLRRAARSSGWQDVEPEVSPTRVASADPNPASSEIGVGGPARARSIPINGPSVAADMGTPGFSDGFGDDPRLADAGAFGAPAQPVASGGAPTGDSEDLGDRYRKRVAGIPAPKGDLTDDQKNKLQMDFFLHLLANNKPGSRFLQNAGEAGVTTSAGYQAQTDKNLARSTQQQQFARDEVFKEMGLSDKSQDNRERARHQKAIEDLQREANRISDMKASGLIDAKAAELEVRKIQAQMAELRASVNPLKGQVEYLRTLLPNADPKELVHMVLTKDRAKGTDELIDQAWARATGANTGMPVPSKEAMLARYKYGETLSRSHPDYRETLVAMGGDNKANREKLDNVLKTSRGLRVVD